MSQKIRSVLLVAVLTAMTMIPAMALAQGATISGKITDDHHAPLVGANVTIDALNVSVGSNSAGVYSITIPAAHVSGQPVVLLARALSHTPQTRTLTLSPGSWTQDFSLASPPPAAPVIQGDAFLIRGIVMTESRQLLDAEVRFAEGWPAIHTDSLGEFRFRSSRDSVRIDVWAEGGDYEPAFVVVHPGRDTLVRIVIMPFPSRPADSFSVGGGVVAAFGRRPGVAPGGDSLLITLASRETFICGSGMAVAEAREATQLFLYVTYVVFRSYFSNEGPCPKEHATWRRLIARTSGLDEIVVVANGVADRFHLGSSTKRWCVVAVAGPNATPLIAGPYPDKDSPAWRNSESFATVGFPGERLPRC